MGLGDEILVTGIIENIKNKEDKICIANLSKGCYLPVTWNNDMINIYKNNPHIIHPNKLENQKKYTMIGDYYSHRGYIDYNHSNLKRNGKTRYITLNNKYKAKRGRIYFDEQELNTISALKRQHGDFMLFNVNTKDKTKNKELPESKWLQLIDCINKTHIKTAVMYGGGYVNQNINNAKLKLNTNNIRSMLCAIAASKFVVTTEGGVHHAAEALGVKCLVIFGGRIDPNILGYEDQINIIDNRTIISDKREIKYPCGMFSECIHCHEIMNDIPVSLIKKEILQNYD